MTGLDRSTVRNRLLLLVDEWESHRLIPLLEAVDLPKGFVLSHSKMPISHAYFLDSGIGSIVAESPEGQRAEAGLFGRDGFSPGALVFGSNSNSCDVLMQVGGHGYRIEADAFQEALEEMPIFKKLLLRYVHTLTTQTSFTALSNAVHHVDERLARWLLMCHDRVDGDEIALTHEFLSVMLAVRRPSVTTALHVLEGNHFIKNERGFIKIQNRKALEEFGFDSYGKPEEEYLRLIGTMR
ncbi:Crp/Fnr family transcriptional regulator [Hoeflea sp.]|uniref:Crp/Fnr family transcriptional regulator n=1 Tax=Hoeflea sp. TaxID=1940281 RepID=UPI0019A69C2D|nr:Crp/Fnr family transcriptional regulator [Hoeflea sp.]MBC7282942.1 Crp/Fnr family transcriptional regulator [Hoeflea sp.]